MHNSKKGSNRQPTLTQQQQEQLSHLLTYDRAKILWQLNTDSLIEDFRQVYETPATIAMHMDDIAQLTMSAQEVEEWPAYRRGELVTFINDVRRLLWRILQPVDEPVDDTGKVD
jgi:hypothetical protein